QSPARDDHAGLDQRLDHRLVGIALFAFVVDNTLAGETGCLIGKSAVFIDGIGNGGIDAVFAKPSGVRSPNYKILSSMTWRSVDEASASIIRDVFAGEKGNTEIITHFFQRVLANDPQQLAGRNFSFSP